MKIEFGRVNTRRDGAVHVFIDRKTVAMCGAKHHQNTVIETDDPPTCRECVRALARLKRRELLE